MSFEENKNGVEGVGVGINRIFGIEGEDKPFNSYIKD